MQNESENSKGLFLFLQVISQYSSYFDFQKTKLVICMKVLLWSLLKKSLSRLILQLTELTEINITSC